MLSFGEDSAEIYDDVPRGDEPAAVAFLQCLAGDRPALELAIGTGRIALPLAMRGVRVDGIDLASGDRVRHKHFGPGVVRSSTMTSDDEEVEVEFQSPKGRITKKLLVSFAGLEAIE